MKISVSKFYQEVTKSKTANSVVCQPALERWGVPFTKGIKGDAVDASYLDVAKAKWEAECAEREKRKLLRFNGKKAKPQSHNPFGATTAPRAKDDPLLPLIVRLDDRVAELQRQMDRLLVYFGAK